jgi:hypothetical protein
VTTSLYDDYLRALRAKVPHVRLVPKAEDPFSKAIDRALRVITFGGQSAYMTRYTTVIGRTIYLPSRWKDMSELDRVIVLRHEAVHLAQFARYGLVGTSLLYLLPIFPMGLAVGRAFIEWEAYRETLRATAELKGIEAAADPALERYIVTQFTSAAYGFMWPFPGHVTRWIRSEVERLRQEL